VLYHRFFLGPGFARSKPVRDHAVVKNYGGEPTIVILKAMRGLLQRYPMEGFQVAAAGLM